MLRVACCVSHGACCMLHVARCVVLVACGLQSDTACDQIERSPTVTITVEHLERRRALKQMRAARCNMQHARCSIQHTTGYIQCATCNVQHLTCNVLHRTVRSRRREQLATTQTTLCSCAQQRAGSRLQRHHCGSSVFILCIERCDCRQRQCERLRPLSRQCLQVHVAYKEESINQCCNSQPIRTLSALSRVT
jgi:hypothetical protein